MASLMGQFSPFWDLAMVAGVFVFFFLLGLFLGRRQAVLMIFGSYAGYSVFTVLPKEGFEALSFFGIGLEVFLFLILCLVFYFFLSFSGFSFSSSRGRKPKKDFQDYFLGSLFGILLAGFLLSSVFSSLSSQAGEQLSGITQLSFVQQYAQVIWISLPILGIIFLNKT